MSNEINKEILIKLNENERISDEVKYFITEALKLEYEERDKTRPFLKNKYNDLINEIVE